MAYPSTGRICKPLKGCAKRTFHYMGKDIYYNVRYFLRIKKFCGNIDRKVELQLTLTAAVPGGEIMSGLNSLSYFFYIFKVILNKHILLF